MNDQNRRELCWYHRGYNDGERGPAAYNDSCVDVTGTVIVLRLNRSTAADCYARGFRDALESQTRRFDSTKLKWLAAFALSLLLFMTLWQ